MANKGLSMRKVREVLRLHYAAGLSTRAIARSLKVSPATVGKYIRRAEEQGLSWPLPEPLDDAALERRLFPAPVLSATQRPLPQWSEVHCELRQPDVTLALVWQEYKAAHPGGLRYSWFCDQYRAWASKLDVVMRQEHRAGEKLFVDYAGRTVAVVDRHTGELRQAQVFVAVLGASNYTFAEATWTQTLPDWIASHVRAFEFLGGCSELVIPDNLGSAVSRAHRYEPDTNPTYHDLARHARTDHIRHPIAEEPLHIDGLVAQQSVDLLDSVLAQLAHRLGETLTNRMNRQRGAGEHPQRRIGQRQHPLRVQVALIQLRDEFADVVSSAARPRGSSPVSELARRRYRDPNTAN